MAFTLIQGVLGLIIGLAGALYYALQSPTSSPREIAAYVLVTVIGVAYLLVTGVDPLNPTGVGIIAFLGAAMVGIMLVNAAARVGAAIPHSTSAKRGG